MWSVASSEPGREPRRVDWTADRFAEATDYRTARALLTALELGLFAPLADAQRSAAELAALIDADPEALTFLLDALAGIGLLEKRDDGDYALGDFARRHLVPGRPEFVGSLAHARARDWTSWGRLTERIRAGRAYGARDGTDAAPRDDTAARGQMQEAIALAPALLDKLEDVGIDCGHHRRLLDVGGGHGVFAAGFCVRWPKLRATIFDLAAPLEVARETIRALGVEAQVTLLPGDYREAPLPTGHDLALLSYTLHGLGPRAARRLLAAIHEALEPGGRVIVQEVLLEEDRTRPVYGALLALGLLLETPNGRCYTQRELLEWLHETGFREIAVVEEMRVVTARKA